MSDKIKVTIWNEFIHENTNEAAAKMYPGGLHKAIARGIANPDFEIRFATLRQDGEHGLSETALRNTDVLLWWGHCAHDEVRDEIVRRVIENVWEGMGLICLHSAHMSKVFRQLNGTSGKLHWREAEERERIWCVNPAHPIAKDVPESFVLDYEEMYGEPFMIAPEAQVVFLSWFEGGEAFRSGVTLQRGNGRIFYFRPGHETYPSFHNENVLKIISNAVRWAKPLFRSEYPKTHRAESYEKISKKDVSFGKAGIILN